MDNMNHTQAGAADGGAFAYNPEAHNTLATGESTATKLSPEEIKRIVAAAVLGADEVFALAGGATAEELDAAALKKAVCLAVDEEQNAEVSVDIVVDATAEQNGLTLKLVDIINCALQTEANLFPKNVQVNMVEFLTAAQFAQNRETHIPIKRL